MTPEERQKIEAALPAKAPAAPRRARKLLIVDYGGYHPSVAHADLAVELMGVKTGAYTAVLSHDTSLLEADKLKQFDAVYLNNTVGVANDVLRPELREGFAAFIRNGGGLVANHGSSVASPNWPEFTEILGATGAAHRQADEKVTLKLDDPAHPLNAPFGGKSFEFTDEIFRFKPPSPRGKVHVLFSIDVSKTDMNQGRCTSACESDDGEYPLSWVRSYGKGRVYYCALGHNAHVFWDPRILQHFLAGIQFALGDLRAETTPAKLDALLAQIATYEHGKSRAALAQLTGLIDGAQNSSVLLGEIEARLLKFLQSNATPAGKAAIFKELGAIATPAAVPVLAPMLVSRETAEPARYALARVPGPAADEALRGALDRASGTMKIGIINSLGQRRDTKAVPALRLALSSPDAAVAEAAISALGIIGGPASMQALAAIRDKTTGARRELADDAYLQCAAHASAGDVSKVYRELRSPKEPDRIRIAALRGIAGTEGSKAIPTLVAEMRSANPKMQAAAIEILAGIPGGDTTAAMMKQFPNLARAGQVRLLTALAGRGDTFARPLLAEAIKSGAVEVRAAALAALTKLGDETSVPLLANTAANAQGQEQMAARQALAELRGAKVDSAITSAIASAQGKVKTELIAAAGDRRAAAAGDAIMPAVRDPDREVRVKALRALRNVAGPAQVAPLLAALPTLDDTQRKDAALALGAALKRSPEQVEQAIVAYRATADVAVRVSLLEAVAQTSTPAALLLLREGLHDANANIRRGSILALSDWPDPAPLADLLALAQSSSNPILPLRGVLKLISVPSSRSNSESANLVAEAMRLANEPAEKRAALALLPSFPCDEALKLAEASLADAAVANEAKLSVQRLRTALKVK